MCLAGDDRVMSGPVMGGGGISADTGPGDPEDAEREQMGDDVPMPPVHSLEPNVFNGKRDYLGHANLMTSFRANGGGEVRSADSGKRHRPMPRSGWSNKPGEPV
jgi:hypothetical protein